MDNSKGEDRESSNSSVESTSTFSPADKWYKANKSSSSEGDEIFTGANMAKDIVTQLKQISQRLGKLDELETVINKTFTKVTEVEAQVNSLTLRVESLECKYRVFDKEIGNLKANLEFTFNDLKELESFQGKD